jgi:hypothetical protein
VSKAFYIRRAEGNNNDSYVLGKISEDGSRVLYVTSASGIKTLPLLSNRERGPQVLESHPAPLRFAGNY